MHRQCQLVRENRRGFRRSMASEAEEQRRVSRLSEFPAPSPRASVVGLLAQLWQQLCQQLCQLRGHVHAIELAGPPHGITDHDVGARIGAQDAEHLLYTTRCEPSSIRIIERLTRASSSMMRTRPGNFAYGVARRMDGRILGMLTRHVLRIDVR
jgi:hypothetical protein